MAFGVQHFVASVAVVLLAGVSACSVEQKDTDAWYSQIMVGSIIGGLLAIVLTVVAALPLCCGIMKAQAKIIAGISIFLGIFFIFVPMIAGMAASSSITDTVCTNCANGCTDEERKAIGDFFSALGVLAAYIGAFGWLALIFGIVAATLGCCICCKCCKMKDEEGAASVVVGQQVVGNPA